MVLHQRGWVRSRASMRYLGVLEPRGSFSRQFSRITAAGNRTGERLAHGATTLSRSPCRPQAIDRLPSVLRLAPTRFNSTTSNHPSASVNVDAVPPAASDAAVDTFNLSSLDAATRLSGEDLASMPVQVGYLKALGLDYGWGPTAVMEKMLEYIHIGTGGPWWLSIALSVLALRLIFLKAYIDASDSAGKTSALRPITQPILDRLRAAQQARDTLGLLKAKSELTSVYARADVKTWKAFVPMLQIPFGYGTFRLLRGMAHLPVPGMDGGGFLWLRDLTVQDPVYFLPLATGYLLYLTVKGTKDAGTSLISPRVMQVLRYGVPPLTVLLVLGWPAALQLSFFVSVILSQTQAAAFRNARIRDWLGITPMMPENPSPASGTPAPLPSAPLAKVNPAPRYQPPTPITSITPSASTAPEKLPKPKGIIDGAIVEFLGMLDEAGKTWARFKGKALGAKTRKPGERTEGEIRVAKRTAKAYEKKRVQELEQQRQELEQRKREAWQEKQRSRLAKQGVKKVA